MTALRLMIAVLLAFSPLSARAQGKADKKASPAGPSCYEQQLKPNASGVQRVLVDYKALNVRVEFGGASRVPYFLLGACKVGGGGGVSCQVECDGGQATMALAGGKLKLETQGIALDALLDTALPMVDDADAHSLVGTYNLGPVPPEMCVGAFEFERQERSSLQRGDFSPRVLTVKKQLADLGYLVQRPDWYFDRAAEIAVGAFQRSAGLPVSGLADAQTIARLNLAARLSGGC